MTDRSTALGLSNAEVRHAMARDRWAIAYEYEARLLNAALGPLVLDIQHVGSTAVPGLLAKPILDIIIAVSDLNYVPALEPALLNAGWIRRPAGDTVDRRYFVKGVPEWRTGHLSDVASGTRAWEDQVRFRDILRSDPEVTAKYAQLKLELARRFPHDRRSYTEGKADLVRLILAEDRQD